MLYVKIVMLVFVTVYIIDISGVVDSIKAALWRLFSKAPYKDYSIKPFDCSLCASFWIVLIYAYVNESDVITSLFIASIASFASIFVSMILTLLRNKLNDLIAWLD